MVLRISCAIPVCLFLSTADAVARDVVDVAASLIGRPYVWGAEGPSSFDCSGLTQYVYKKFGIELPRRAISQSKIGDATGGRLRRGDLLFFSTDPGQKEVTHVGLYEGGDLMINASKRHAKVRRDDLTDSYWAERFMFARRVGSDGSVEDVRARRDDGGSEQRRPSSDKRRKTIQVLGQVATILLERGRR